MVHKTDETQPICALDSLRILEWSDSSIDIESALQSLREDKIVLFRKLDPARADVILRQIASAFGLLERLELQASFADMLGQRRRVSQYRMTVHTRPSYQFVPPHSEGDSFTAMQLASFYCSENSTDGGVTVLVHIDGSSASWASLREQVTRLRRESRALAPGELRRARALFHLHDPPYIHESDTILCEYPSEIPGIALARALAIPRKVRSVILERDVYSYWDSIATIDRSAVATHALVLGAAGVLTEPLSHDIAELDSSRPRRIWSSGVDHASLFQSTVTHKLVRGDLIFLNNFTWAHAVTNWTPESGVRDVSAAFA